MYNMRNRKNKRIFASMVKNYMLSVFLMLLVALIIGVGAMMLIGKDMEAGKGPQVVASSVVREDYENIDMKDIRAISGWVEILDEDLNIIYVKGNKKDIQKQYSRDDMFAMMDVTKDNHDLYHATIESFEKEVINIIVL